MTLNLTPEVVAYAKEQVAIEQFYEQSDTVTAQHVLYNEFIEETKWKGLPKILFYILLNETFGFPNLKDADNNLGYALKLIKHG